MGDLLHDREVLVEVLVYHQRTNTSGCHCGWAVLGHSYAEHVASVYEDSLRVRQDPSPAAPHPQDH